MVNLVFVSSLAAVAALVVAAVALSPANKKLTTIVAVVAVLTTLATGAAVADFTTNPSGHAEPTPSIAFTADQLSTLSGLSCTWTASGTVRVDWSGTNSWGTPNIQRTSTATYASLANGSAGATTYSDATASNSATTTYGYKVVQKSGTNWVSNTVGPVSSATCNDAVNALATPLTTAEIRNSYSIAINSTGDIAIADTSANYIEYVPKYTGTYFGVTMNQGTIWDIAGTGTAGTPTDGNTATTEKVNAPGAITFDSHGNLLFADTGAHEVNLLPLTGTATYYGASRTAGKIYQLVGNGTFGDGSNVAANGSTIKSPGGVAVDSNDIVYVSDTGNNKIKAYCASACTAMGVSVGAGKVQTIAGTGTASAVDATLANMAVTGTLNTPNQMAWDSGKNTLYIADSVSHKVRTICSSSCSNSMSTGLQTFAGSGTLGDSASGTAKLSATFSAFEGVTLDSSNNVIIGDQGNTRIKLVYMGSNCAAGACPYGYPGSMTTGSVYVIAGTGGSAYDGNGVPTYSGGSATTNINSRIGATRGVAIGPDGNLYFSDGTNTMIRELAPDSTAYDCASGTACSNGTDIVDVIGNGTAGHVTSGATAGSNGIKKPQNMAVDSAGDVFFADPSDNRIKEYVAGTGLVKVVAGTGSTGPGGDGSLAILANMTAPSGVAYDETNKILYLTSTSNNKIRAVCLQASASCTAMGTSIGAGNIQTVAGTGTAGTSVNGTQATSAKVNAPQDVAWDSTNSKLYIADTGSHTVKVVSCAASCSLATSWTMSVFAGTDATSGFGGDGGSPTAVGAKLNAPQGVAVDSSGNVLIADTGNHVIRRVASNVINTVAGQGTLSGSTDNVAATSGKLSSPGAVAIDSSGNIYVADTGNHKIRTFTVGGNISTSIGTGVAGVGNNNGYYSGATLDSPGGIAVVNGGNIYWSQYTATSANAQVRVWYGTHG